jgi:hypothetical protein
MQRSLNHFNAGCTDVLPVIGHCLQELMRGTRAVITPCKGSLHITGFDSHTILMLCVSAVGTLPPSWGTLSNLRTCNLWRNKLQGPLPSSWSGMASLVSVNLHSNTLTGVVWASDMSGSVLLCTALCSHHRKHYPMLPACCQPQSGRQACA